MPSARGNVEIADRGLHVRRDAVPVELRIEIDEIGGRGIAELTIESGFLEFVIKRVVVLGRGLIGLVHAVVVPSFVS